MGKLVAYLDESGTHDPRGAEPSSEYAVIAGYVAEDKEWKHFNRAWRKVLRAYDARIFHMKDYAHSRGEFQGWSKVKRDSFCIALTDAIHGHALFGLGGLVLIRDYDTIVPEALKHEIRHPWYFCFSVLMRGIRQSYKYLRPGRIRFVFDRNYEFQSTATEMFHRLKGYNPEHAERLDEIRFLPKDNIPALQAADFLAWEVRRYADHKFSHSMRPIRKSMEALTRGNRLLVGYYDADQFHDYVARRSATHTPT